MYACGRASLEQLCHVVVDSSSRQQRQTQKRSTGGLSLDVPAVVRAQGKSDV